MGWLNCRPPAPNARSLSGGLATSSSPSSSFTSSSIFTTEQRASSLRTSPLAAAAVPDPSPASSYPASSSPSPSPSLPDVFDPASAALLFSSPTKSSKLSRPATPPPPPPERNFSIATVSSVDKITAEEWNACADPDGQGNPFVTHEFISAVEGSGSACREQGWIPMHVTIKDGDKLAAIVPAYIKTHSYGEYVFDQAWARFSHQALSKPYYPKLQACVPFTPVPGPRVLLHPKYKDDEEVLIAAARGLKAATDSLGISSAHVTFLSGKEAAAFVKAGWLQRIGIQYHFDNDGYGDFEDYLAALKQQRRKNVRQEIKSVANAGLSVARLKGADVAAPEWDRFYQFYLNTVDKRWGTAYLTREFFHRLREGPLSDKVLLIAAREGGAGGAGAAGTANGSGLVTAAPGPMVGGALNLVGKTTLYGRNWGAEKEVKNLHFTVCYYEAIRAAIDMGLKRVEAGAQGEHKISRGYLPNLTYSVHYLSDARLRTAVRDFLGEETADMFQTLEFLRAEASPFKDK